MAALLQHAKPRSQIIAKLLRQQACRPQALPHFTLEIVHGLIFGQKIIQFFNCEQLRARSVQIARNLDK